MRAYRWAAASLVVIALLWGYHATAGGSARDYQVAALGWARAASDALGTAELTGEAVLAKRATRPYAESRLSDARTALAAAEKRFAGAGAPDETCERMRDELGKLLARANQVLSVIESAVTEQNVADIEPVTAALDAFVRDHRADD